MKTHEDSIHDVSVEYKRNGMFMLKKLMGDRISELESFQKELTLKGKKASEVYSDPLRHVRGVLRQVEADTLEKTCAQWRAHTSRLERTVEASKTLSHSLHSA